MSTLVESESQTPPAPRRKWGLILGLLLALAGGGAGFYVSWSGLLHKLLAGDVSGHVSSANTPEISYLPLDPIIISLAPGGASKHLKFVGQLEVDKALSGEVQSVLPRIMDVLNSYLRAVDIVQLEDPGALFRLRAQMLRRIQIVTGEGRVRDLLVQEFILN